MSELVCRKCGHRAAYHGMKWCKHHPGGTQRRECDCDGWEAAALAAAPAGLDVERLAVAMNDAGVTPDELRLGRDLSVPAKRIAAAYAATDPDAKEAGE